MVGYLTCPLHHVSLSYGQSGAHSFQCLPTLVLAERTLHLPGASVNNIGERRVREFW